MAMLMEIPDQYKAASRFPIAHCACGPTRTAFTKRIPSGVRVASNAHHRHACAAPGGTSKSESWRGCREQGRGSLGWPSPSSVTCRRACRSYTPLRARQRAVRVSEPRRRPARRSSPRDSDARSRPRRSGAAAERSGARQGGHGRESQRAPGEAAASKRPRRRSRFAPSFYWWVGSLSFGGWVGFLSFYDRFPAIPWFAYGWPGSSKVASSSLGCPPAGPPLYLG